MSTTSNNPSGTVYIVEEPDAIAKKFRSAVTDTGAEIRRSADKPGISNLIDILAVVRGVAPEAIEAEFAGSQYGPLKSAVAEAVIDYLAPVRERYGELRADEPELERILGRGAEQARTIAARTLADVREAMGVGPPR